MTIAARHTGKDNEGTDLLPAEVFTLPLLDAVGEKRTDMRKWAAVRACQRLLVSHASGRRLLERFAEACLESVLDPHSFVPRDRYSHLRTEIGNHIPGKPGSQSLVLLRQQLRQKLDARVLMQTLRDTEMPATLVIGLASIELRSLGVEHRDATADTLLYWMPHFFRQQATADPGRAVSLQYRIDRYMRARDTLILHNMRLVYKLARRNLRDKLPISDLVQEGARGLLRAAEKFDYRLGYRFTTYAFNWINQHIQRAGSGDDSLLTYPAHIHQQINKVHRVRLEEWSRTGVDPSLQDVANQTGLSLDKVGELRQLSNITRSIDQPLSDNSELSWGEMLADPRDTGANPAEHHLLSRLLRSRLHDLDEIEQKVLSRRFGLDAALPMTLKQVALQLNISSEWVRHLEKSALSKLRDDAVLAEAFEEL